MPSPFTSRVISVIFWLSYYPWFSLTSRSTSTSNVDGNVNLKVSSHDVRGLFKHFWKSTGFCPPLPHQNAANFDLSKDMKLNLAYIGALPFRGVHQVRVHWLFELVTVKEFSSRGPLYDFSSLDEFISLLSTNGLAPGFELMGNPSAIYTDFENATQVYWWKDLVTQTAERYVAHYGINVVKRWNFETWNEPNGRRFGSLNMTVQGFLNYYDACSEGLKAVDVSLTLGGLGDAGRDLQGKQDFSVSMYSKPFFSHVVNGRNYFTGETGVRLDFVAFHEKGDGRGSKILSKEENVMRKIKSLFPELVDKPFYNDEADPLEGWNKPRTWRAGAVYPAVALKVIAQHQNMVMANEKHIIKTYTLLSNDNGFLSYYPHQFTQRTLAARFQMNNTDPPYVTFIRKPIYCLMSILSLTGERQVHVEMTDARGFAIANNSDIGSLASIHEPIKTNSTSDSWQMTLVIYQASDPEDQPAQQNGAVSINITWIIDPPSYVTALKLMTYTIYNGNYSPFDVWYGKFGSVSFPSLWQMASIRKHEDPLSRLTDVPVRKGPVPLPSSLPLKHPHVIFMHLCAKSNLVPEKVEGVRFINVTYGHVMVLWNDDNIHTKCLLTYEVELSATGTSSPFRRVNGLNSIVNLFLFETDSEAKVRGYYRVRAVDYWKRGGVYSDPLPYT